MDLKLLKCIDWNDPTDRQVGCDLLLDQGEDARSEELRAWEGEILWIKELGPYRMKRATLLDFAKFCKSEEDHKRVEAAIASSMYIVVFIGDKEYLVEWGALTTPCVMVSVEQLLLDAVAVSDYPRTQIDYVDTDDGVYTIWQEGYAGWTFAWSSNRDEEPVGLQYFPTREGCLQGIEEELQELASFLDDEDGEDAEEEELVY